MSDNIIPFDVQVEILKKLEVKPLMKFRSVSKQYKSLIDSPKFISEYGARHPHPHRLLVRYTQHKSYDIERYVWFFENDDDGDSFTQQEFAPRVSNVLTKLFNDLRMVGTCHGLWCFYGLYYYPDSDTFENDMIILWNPSIRKSIGIASPGELGWPDEDFAFLFGVCPVTSDPFVVKSIYLDGWQVEIFTLSSGFWKRVPSINLPSSELVQLTWTQVVIDRFIYVLAYDNKVAMEREDESDKYFYMIVQFDMITKEFAIIDLPDNLAHQLPISLTLSKIRESLVVVEYNPDMDNDLAVWMWMMMEEGLTKSFTMLFTINTPVMLVLGFKKNEDPIIVTQEVTDGAPVALEVYEPCSQRVNNLGINGEDGSFFMDSYMETLLLLDQPDCFIY